MANELPEITEIKFSESGNTYQLKDASARADIMALQEQLGNFSTALDEINGETI